MPTPVFPTIDVVRFLIRTLGRQLNSDFTYNVRDYDAKGDGVTDDSAAFQAAIDAATAAGGGDVHVPKSSAPYVVSNVVVKTGVHLRSENKAVLLQKANAATNSQTLLVPAGASDVRISGLTVNGNKANQVNTVNGIFIEAASRVKVLDVTVVNTQRIGIVADGGCFDVEIAYCTVTDTGFFGIVGAAYRNITAPVRWLDVHHCYVARTANGGSAIGLVAAIGANLVKGYDCNFSYNRIHNSHHDGITGYSPENRRIVATGNIVTFDDGWAQDGGGHIVHLGGNDITVTNNIGKGSSGAAIVLSNYPNEAPPGGFDFVVSDNIIDTTLLQSNGEAILLQNYSRGTVANNKVRLTAQQGIAVLGNVGGVAFKCTDVGITGNQIDNSDLEGIIIQDSERIAIQGGSITAAGRRQAQPGIRFRRAQRSTISGVVIQGSSGDGIRFVDDGDAANACVDVAVGTNTLIGNTNWGLTSANSTNRITHGVNVYQGNGSGTFSLVGANNVAVA